MFLFNIWKLSEIQSYLVIALAVVAVLCLIGIIILSIKNKSSKSEEKVENKDLLEVKSNNNNEIENVDFESSDEKVSQESSLVPESILEDNSKEENVLELKDVPEDNNKAEHDIETNDILDDNVEKQDSNIDITTTSNDLNVDDKTEVLQTNETEGKDNVNNSSDIPVVKGNSFIQVSYLKSFKAKISMGKDELREFYRAIKSHCLKYGLKSRMSWGCETIYKGRVAYLKLTIRGKNLNVNLALDPKDYEGTKYFFKDTSSSKKYEMVPMRVKVKSPRSLKYVLELIDIMMKNAMLETSDKYDCEVILEEKRSLEDNLALGLIKKVESIKEGNSNLDLSNNIDLDDEDDDDEDDEDYEKIIENNESTSSQLVLVNYIKSFRAKVSMANEDARSYYEVVKNHLLSYKLKSRMSWGTETIYKGRVAYAKLTIRGKNLNVNLALDPKDYEGTKYFFKDTSSSKKYEMVPMRVKVKSPRSLKYVLELIDIMMEKNDFKKLDTYSSSETAEPVRSFDENLALGLIKKLKGKKASLEEIEQSRITKDVLDTSYVEEVSAQDMDNLEIDNEILEMVMEIVGTHKKSGKKGIINLDDINESFEENEIVSLKSLKERKLISSNVGQVKCLARGKLNKALIFSLDDYSSSAIKMILLTGGEIR